MRPEGNIARLGELVPEVLERHHLQRRVRQRAAMALWPQVVGRDIARNAWPLGVRAGVMSVGAVNHAWAQTLSLMRGEIVAALNAAAGEAVLRDLQVRVAAPPRRAPAPGAAAAPSPPPLAPEQQQRVRELTAHIQDPALRAQVRRAVAALLRLRLARERSGERKCGRCGALFVGRGRTCGACTARR